MGCFEKNQDLLVIKVVSGKLLQKVIEISALGKNFKQYKLKITSSFHCLALRKKTKQSSTI